MMLRKYKSNKSLDRYLAKLEREAGDDLVMLLEHGPDCFETYELDLLLKRVLDQGKQFLFYKKMGLFILIAAIGSIIISIYAFLHAQLFFGYLFLAFLPVYLGLGGIMFYRFHKSNLTINKTSYLINLLKKEIVYRENKAFF